MSTCCLLKDFGTTVRRLREARNWSQEQLAEHADLNRSYVGEIERGQVVASILTIEKLAQAYGLSGAVLLEHCERSRPTPPAKGINLAAIAC